MADQDERPGLLSKVAQFVRNPSKDWPSDDGASRLPEDSAYDKQMLKAMIERKRQNDLIRKREFDYLRKLRNHTSVTSGSRQPPVSSFLASQHESGYRADTIKKIDEIEAQMSKQWWRGQPDAGPTRPSPDTNLTPTLPPALEPTRQMDMHPQAASFAPTEPIQIAKTHEDAASYAPTVLSPPTLSVEVAASPSANPPSNRPPIAAASAFKVDFSSTDLLTLHGPVLASDPELEEAAIRFANGDDQGAANVLRAALDKPGVSSATAVNWAAALLDLYRLGGNRPTFDAMVRQYAHLWPQGAPAWQESALMDFTVTLTAEHRPLVGAHWVSPAVLDASSMRALSHALQNQPSPWILDWRNAESMDESAVPTLRALAQQWVSQPLVLEFAGENELLAVLQNRTPVGDAAVDQVWWHLRLTMLQVMQREEDFELAALDFCVTYELSPPQWERPVCSCRTVELPALSKPAPLAVSTSMPLMGSTGLALRGNITGDVSASLDAMESALARPQDVLVIECQDLERMDFTAAGSLLNWAVKRQSEGKRVELVDLHRLVAAFFHVLGIQEHAKLVLRDL
ncbi:STAS domain-containing protein [Curvibacter sp. CHRR-16]|uniref:STAS domain-containing protein n=1 Tax=Curvibacter sp. CHRR-16 TaxID=2835872 RepID=UPI001BDA6F64|nr:STAS domain-containing protein [Curvibacter sp. CHRR-16]MBT0569977.1 STAS domain-containing protein [Curvibacter sp. CHRR-16]